jgi:hypothetical protein
VRPISDYVLATLLAAVLHAHLLFSDLAVAGDLEECAHPFAIATRLLGAAALPLQELLSWFGI